MSTKAMNASFRMGTIADPEFFFADCAQGDTHLLGPIPFTPPFPDDNVRVIALASAVSSAFPAVPAIVCIAEQVDRNGFRLKARNSDLGTGFSNFNWMAVSEVPTLNADGSPLPPPDIRLGAVQPRLFFQDGVVTQPPGLDWQLWAGVPFSNPMSSGTVVVATANNLNLSPFYWLLQDTSPFDSNNPLVYHNSAVVGIIQSPSATGFSLAARNSDTARGICAFYWAAFDAAVKPIVDPTVPDMVIDTGIAEARSFAVSNTQGDWNWWEIFFRKPFLTPPVVLVTANDQLGGGQLIPTKANIAAVGIAQNVTPYGFRLAGRSSDCAAGQAGFYWVAIGCSLGCG